MNVHKLECPNCHAALDSDYGNEGIFFCKYCGQKMIVEEMQNAEYDLKIRKMEMEHETEKIELEHRQQNIKYAYEREKMMADNRFRTIYVIGCFLMIIILIVVALIAVAIL